MKKHLSSVLVSVIALTFLSACSWRAADDPFERIPDAQTELIYGELFPFSVSVSTRATHRLERDSKLVGYLTSDLVRLEDFEGQEVELEGTWQAEKMREIFWVESVKVADSQDEDEAYTRFATKNFTLLYPSHWDYTESPDSKLYFVDKEDTSRRVFLTLSVEDFSPEAGDIEPNFVLSGIAGTKTITPQDNGREQERIVLYSNDGAKQYVFKADYAFDDFDKKRALLDLLESFVEGESQVTTVIEGEKIQKAEAEAAKLAELNEREELEAKARLVDEIVEEDEQSFLDRLLSRSDEPEAAPATVKTPETEPETPAPAEPDEVDRVQEAIKEAVTQEAVYDYQNLVDARSYPYTSQALGYTLKTPYNHWYQNYGGANGSVFEMGFADNPINGRSTVDFYLRAKNGTPPTDTTAVLDGDTLTITKAWKEGVLEITGPVEFKDAMWSVLESAQAL